MRREQTLRKEKADADEATRKHEQLYMEHELKRQKSNGGSEHHSAAGEGESGRV